MSNKNIRKVALSTMAASAAVVSIAPVASAAETKTFKDVSPSNDHYSGVQWLASKGIEGYADGTFGVNKELTRPHAAIMFTRALGLEIPNKSDVTKYFSDVTASTPYAEFIAATGKAGVFKGNVTTKAFNANQKLNREQMATTLVNAFNLKGTENHVDVNLKNVSDTHKASVQILADLGITSQLNDYRPLKPVTRGQFATFLKLAYEASNKAAAAAVESIKSVDSTTLEVTFNTGLTDEEIKALTFKFSPELTVKSVARKADTSASPAAEKTTVVLATEEQKAGTTYTLEAVNGQAVKGDVKVETPVVETKVETVKAANVNRLEVIFNKAVDTKETKFAVKRGTVSEDVKVSWNEGKTVATLEKSVGNFVEGDYTVTVSGIEGLVNPENTAKVEAEQVKHVEIDGTQLQRSATAPVNVKFINQYGQEATVAPKDVTIEAYNKTDNTRPVSRIASTKFELDASRADLKDEIQVTAVYKGLTATKTLTVVPAATVGEVTLDKAVLPEGKKLFTKAGTKDVEIAYTAKDTLGSTYKLKDADRLSNGVQFYSSDKSIVDADNIKIDGTNKIKISEFGDKAGTVTITALTPATGKTSTISIEVKENEGAPYAITLDKTAEFAAGSTTTFYITPKVTDKYENEIAAKDLQSADYALSSTNSDVAAVGWGTGENAGKIAVTPKVGAKKGQSTTITAIVKASGQQAQTVVTASDAAVPTTIEVEKDTKIPTAFLVGAVKELKFDVQDQYGTDALNDTDFSVEFKTSDEGIIALSNATTSITDPKVTATAKKNGTAVLKAQLKKGTTVVAEKSFTINVIANDSKVTYSVEPIDKVYKKAVSGVSTVTNASSNDDKKAAVESGYAEEVALNAKAADGTVTPVPQSAIVGSPQLTQPTKADGSATAGALEWFEYNGKYYVVTKTSFNETAQSNDFQTANGTADLTGKIAFTINADDAVKVVEQNITVSKENAQAQSLTFKNLAPGNKEAKEVSEIRVSSSADYTTVLPKDAFAWVTDQFGGTSAVASSDLDTINVVAIDGAQGVNDDTVSVTSAGKVTITDTNSNTAFTKKDAKVRVVATKDGKTAFFNVVVTDGSRPTATLPASTNAATNSATKLVAKFDKPLYNGQTAIADGTDVKSLFSYDGTAGNYTSAVYNTADNTVTFTFTAAEDGKKLTATSSVKDSVGNVVNDVYTYADNGTIWTK